MRLEPLVVWFQPAAGPLLPQLRPFLLAAGQAQAGPGVGLLRWAITAAEPARGLRIEAVLLVGQLDGDGPLTGSGGGLESGFDSVMTAVAEWGSASAASAPTSWRR